MPKKHRLSHADFSGFRPQKRERGSLFLLGWSKNPDNKPKFAILVSKKVSPKATERNVVKRRSLAALRQLHVVGLSGSWVFTAKKEAKDATLRAIFDDISDLVLRVSR